MSGAQTGGETSMEDILASIRRILTDDETASPQGEGHEASAAAAHAPATSTEPGRPDVFELDQSMIVEEQEPAMSPPIDDPAPLEAVAAPEEGSPLLDAGVAAAAGASIGALSRAVVQRQAAIYQGGPSIEDMVRQELRPLLKTWLDANLPPLVERLVQAEIERVVRR